MGGLYYPTTETRVLIGSKDSSDSRTGIELESTYSTTEDTEPTKTFTTGGFSKLALAVSYTMGAAETSNTIELKIEQSPDRTNWYQLTNDTTSGGTSTLNQREFTSDGNNASNIDFDVFLDIAYKYMRVSCKETGVATNKGNVFVEATLSGR